MTKEQLLAALDNKSIKPELAKTEEILRQQALADELLRPIIINQLDRGGKRLRPLIVLLASSIDGQKSGGTRQKAAAAVELIHQASLLHDQIIDGHTKADTAYQILAGDFLLAQGICLAAEVNPAAAMALSKCVQEMASGQAIQFSPSYKADPENPAYLKTAGLKTASLFTAACELAASLSGYNSSEFEAIKVFGRNFGLAFQIIDDCIDQEFPHQKRKKAVDAAGRLVANAKCSLEVLQNDKTKINLSRLAEIYLEASLPKNS